MLFNVDVNDAILTYNCEKSIVINIFNMFIILHNVFAHLQLDTEVQAFVFRPKIVHD